MYKSSPIGIIQLEISRIHENSQKRCELSHYNMKHSHKHNNGERYDPLTCFRKDCDNTLASSGG